MSFPCHRLHHEAGPEVEPWSRMVSSSLIKMGAFRKPLQNRSEPPCKSAHDRATLPARHRRLLSIIKTGVPRSQGGNGYGLPMTRDLRIFENDGFKFVLPPDCALAMAPGPDA